MTIPHFGALRAAGARHAIDELIRLGRSLCQSPPAVDAHHRLVHALRSQTDLLHRSNVNLRTLDLSPRLILWGVHQLAEEHGHWFRSPESFRRVKKESLHRQWIRFVRHLLEPYRCPPFLSISWLSPMSKPWWRQLHLHLAGGGSFRTFRMPDGTTGDRPTGHFLADAPDDATPDQAIRWAQVLSASRRANLPPDRPLARRLMQQIPVTEDSQAEAFWKDSLRFFVRHSLSNDAFSHVVRTVKSIRFRPGHELIPGAQFEHPLDPDLRIGAYSLRQVNRLVAHWRMIFRDRYRDQIVPLDRRDFPWQRINVGPIRFDVDAAHLDHWEIVPLLTQNELTMEGKILNHCVATYTDECRKGYTSIWSLRQWTGGKMRRRVTVEVWPTKKEITVARGKSNRLANDRERAFIRQWARKESLTISTHALGVE